MSSEQVRVGAVGESLTSLHEAIHNGYNMDLSLSIYLSISISILSQLKAIDN